MYYVFTKTNPQSSELVKKSQSTACGLIKLYVSTNNVSYYNSVSNHNQV